MCSVPPTWSRKTTRNGGGVAACPQVAACPLGVCCARASGRLLWSACACGGINTNLLARERRPGRWEAERASRAMRRATAGVGGRDRRDGPGVRRAEAGGSGGGVGPRPPRAGPGRRLGGANPNRAQRAPGGRAGASPGAGGRWGAKLGPATCGGARGPGGGGRGLGARRPQGCLRGWASCVLRVAGSGWWPAHGRWGQEEGRQGGDTRRPGRGVREDPVGVGIFWTGSP